MRLPRIDIPETLWRPIAQAVCDEHAPLTVRELLYTDRSRWAIVARAKFWDVLKSKLNYSFSSIARISGHHHTAVMYAIRKPGLMHKTYKDGTLDRPMRRHRNTPEIQPGAEFGDLTVLRRAENVPHKGKGWSRHPYYWCICSCGNEIRVAKCALNGGNKKKCGKRHPRDGAPRSAGRVRKKEQENAGL